MEIELYNNNCLNILDSLVNDNCVIVTDPPFNIGYHYEKYKDNMNEEDYYKMLTTIFSKCPSVVIHYPENLYKISNYIGIPKRVISWVYNSNTAKQHRDIAFFGITPNMNQVKQPYKNPNDRRIKERIKNGYCGGRLYDWWNINQVKNVSKKNINHPCVMPLEVMEKIVGILPKDITVIDCFMGSGTTGIAVKNMNIKQNPNRKFIGIEIDSKYYELAKERIDDYGLHQIRP